MSDIRHKWYDIGLSLHVRRNDLDDLKHSQANNQRKLLTVINIWLTSKLSPVTWETVITAMKSPIVNNKDKAREIHQYLSTGKSNKLLLIITRLSMMVFRLLL